MEQAEEGDKNKEDGNVASGARRLGHRGVG